MKKGKATTRLLRLPPKRHQPRQMCPWMKSNRNKLSRPPHFRRLFIRPDISCSGRRADIVSMSPITRNRIGANPQLYLAERFAEDPLRRLRMELDCSIG